MTPTTCTFSPTRLYVLISLFLGICFLFLIPPFQGQDEPAHFTRGWQVSQGEWIPKIRQDDWTGMVAPLSLFNDLHYFRDRRFTFSSGQCFLASEMLDRFNKMPLPSEEERFQRTMTGQAGNAVAYLPQSIGIGIARLTNSSFVATLYAGRLTNLLASILLTAWAISLIPIGRWTVTVIALLPGLLFQRSTLSLDGIAFALSLLSLAALLRLIIKHPAPKLPEPGQQFVLIVLATALTLAKQVYGFIWGLTLLFLKTASRWKSLLFLLLLVLSVCLINLWWSNHVSNHYPPSRDDYPHEQVDPAIKIQLLQNTPLDFVKRLYHTLKTEAPQYLTQMVGMMGVISPAQIEPLGCYLLLLNIVLIALLEHPQNKLHHRLSVTIIIGAAAALTTLSMFLLMYIIWTPLPHPGIEGMQGRYFLPMLPMLAIIAPLWKKPRLSESRWLLPSAGLFIVFSTITTILTLTYHFYRC